MGPTRRRVPPGPAELPHRRRPGRTAGPGDVDPGRRHPDRPVHRPARRGSRRRAVGAAGRVRGRGRRRAAGRGPGLAHPRPRGTPRASLGRERERVPVARVVGPEPARAAHRGPGRARHRAGPVLSGGRRAAVGRARRPRRRPDLARLRGGSVRRGRALLPGRHRHGPPRAGLGRRAGHPAARPGPARPAADHHARRRGGARAAHGRRQRPWFRHRHDPGCGCRPHRRARALPRRLAAALPRRPQRGRARRRCRRRGRDDRGRQRGGGPAHPRRRRLAGPLAARVRPAPPRLGTARPGADEPAGGRTASRVSRG